MRKGIGYALLALATAAALPGLSFALLGGGYEGDAVRAAGIEFLLLAAGVGSQERSSSGPVGSKPSVRKIEPQQARGGSPGAVFANLTRATVRHSCVVQRDLSASIRLRLAAGHSFCVS